MRPATLERALGLILSGALVAQQPGRAHSKYVQFDPSKLKWIPPPPWREKKTDKPSHRRIAHGRQDADAKEKPIAKEKHGKDTSSKSQRA